MIIRNNSVHFLLPTIKSRKKKSLQEILLYFCSYSADKIYSRHFVKFIFNRFRLCLYNWINIIFEFHIYLLLFFAFQSLTDITMLRYHRHLQYINVANNNISCLSPLSGLPYLMYLNISHNKIEHVSNFTPPWYLTYVNLSYNHLTDIGDLSGCWSIVRLNLSHNILESISGLENLK